MSFGAIGLLARQQRKYYDDEENPPLKNISNQSSHVIMSVVLQIGKRRERERESEIESESESESESERERAHSRSSSRRRFCGRFRWPSLRMSSWFRDTGRRCARRRICCKPKIGDWFVRVRGRPIPRLQGTRVVYLASSPIPSCSSPNAPDCGACNT